MRESLTAGAVAFTAAAFAAPVTLTVTDFVKMVLFGPFTFNVYVVVAVGKTCRMPRAATRTASGSIVTPLGFSVAQVNATGCPAWTASGFAMKLIIRAGGT